MKPAASRASHRASKLSGLNAFTQAFSTNTAVP
jgi:hypothetical protein